MVGDLDAAGEIAIDSLANVRLPVWEPPELNSVAEVLQVLREVCALSCLPCSVRPLRADARARPAFESDGELHEAELRDPSIFQAHLTREVSNF